MRETELLAISFAYPPLAYPRSIQVARLLKHLPCSTVLLCGDERNVRKDSTIEPEPESFLRECLRVGFTMSTLRRTVARAGRYLRIPLLDKTPDMYSSWKHGALRAIRDFMAGHEYRPDVMVTFGQPMSDHLVGLELKRHYGIPWIAHFSDPWVDNPFENPDPLSRRVNRSLEHSVVGHADRVIFTSRETADLVMAKYPGDWSVKVRVLPHGYDSSWLASVPPATLSGRMSFMYVGSLYGIRTPASLLAALRELGRTNSVLEHLEVGFVGTVERKYLGYIKDVGLSDIVRVYGARTYSESLEAMARADVLIAIDAPSSTPSVFLPSKLVDYMMFKKPILGLTPPEGASAHLLRRLECPVVAPDDTGAIMRAVTGLYEKWRSNQLKVSPVFEKTADEYDIRHLASSWDNMFRELHDGNPE